MPRLPTVLALTLVAIGAYGSLGLAYDEDPPAAARQQGASAANEPPAASEPWTAPRRHTPPSRTILANDPNHDPRGISRTLARYVDSVPAGETISIETYFLGSSVTLPALARAVRRGVNLQVVLNGSTRDRYQQGEQLAALLDRDRTDDSWVVFTTGSARGPDGVRSIDHNKIWRFSRVGDRRWVTVVGSYNNSDAADRHAFGLMWSVAGREIYLAFGSIFNEAARARPVPGDPARRRSGHGWSAYFLPTTSHSPAADPVMRRLAVIPAAATTQIRIAMFTMWDLRGEWIADRLAELADGGARVTFIAGPLVGRPIIDILLRAGVHVEGGCWPDEGTYVHGKDMSATWVAEGEQEHWTWIGSDNWTSNTLVSDQAVLGLAGRRLHQQFVAHFEELAERPDHFGHPCDDLVAGVVDAT